MILIKGGVVYYGDVSNDARMTTFVRNETLSIQPFISALELSNGASLATLDFHPELLKKIILNHNQNNLVVHYDLNGSYDQNDIIQEWRIEGYSSEWKQIPSFRGSPQILILPYLEPGKYTVQIKLRTYNALRQSQLAKLDITIKPPAWETWWFWTVVIAGISSIVFLIVKLRERSVRKQERLKSAHEKELLELEAKALRAQMNPHFIFNCLNSIKSLMQEKEMDKGVTYLTTFSKLIRTLFNNADKKEITLYDEIETCKLYLQLEAMRFDSKFSYSVNIDAGIDLKSVQVPALIIQPFIENAIWHGIVPKGGSGNVELSVKQKADTVEIIIDDNGIGREASLQNKAETNIGHQSKGVNLTQSRLELDNLLQQRQARLEIIDKKDKAGNSAGTKVTISLPQEV